MNGGVVSLEEIFISHSDYIELYPTMKVLLNNTTMKIILSA